jgi:aryl-alcohol dehydrogenase-like predicted oxidoreductase
MRHLELDGVPALSRIGLGTWQFGSREWGYGSEYASVEAARIVRRSLEFGVTLIDTAEIYGFGRSERIVGAAVGADRERVFLATKIFPVFPVAAVVRRRAAGSARRLGVRRLDLYQVHQPNPLVRDRTTMRGMRELQDRGVVGEVGVSNYSLGRWQAAEKELGHRVLSNQVSYSLADRRAELDLIPYAAATGRVVVAYSPLSRGFLSTRYGPDRRPVNAVRRRGLFSRESLERAQGLFATLREVADAHQATPAQVALAWVIRHPERRPGRSQRRSRRPRPEPRRNRCSHGGRKHLQTGLTKATPTSGPVQGELFVDHS